MIILGIDGGLDGGLVLLDGNTVRGRLPMPTQDKPDGKGRVYDLPFIIDTFKSWHPDHVFLEKAQPMPAFPRPGSKTRPQGITSTFAIGLGYGIMQGILAALQLPYTLVHPRTWQSVMFRDMAKQNTKAASALVATRLWPGVDWRASARCKKLHDGLTDAVCIAEYGRRLLNGGAGAMCAGAC